MADFCIFSSQKSNVHAGIFLLRTLRPRQPPDMATAVRPLSSPRPMGPERSIRGADLGSNSIQVGLSRHVVTKYVEEWVTEIDDLTPLVRKIHTLLKAGQVDKAKKFLPPERVYVAGACGRSLILQV